MSEVSDDRAVPDDIYGTLETAVAHAWEAYHRQDWPNSLARWERIHQIWMDFSPPYVHAATSLLNLGRINEAVILLQDGFELFPGNVEILTNYAAAHLANSDYSTASSILEQAIGKFPDNPEVAVSFLKMAIDYEDYQDAMRRIAILAAAYPSYMSDNISMREMVAHTQLCFQLNTISEEMTSCKTAAAKLDRVASSEAIDLQNLMGSFESLGENCEFGLVQRHFGIEPLGLLRWTATSIVNLTKALSEDFAGVGDPEQTKLFEIGSEYMTGDIVYGMGSHTFVKVNKEKEDKIWKSLTQRLRYLKRKMLEDLIEGSRIFVYHSENGASMAEILELQKAICRHGKRFLLYVTQASGDNIPGTVADMGGGLMIGYMDRLGPDRQPEGNYWNPSHQVWLTLCKAGYALKSVHELT